MQMKPYEQYSTIDFITDDFFIDWVLQPTPEHNQFWEVFLKNFPDKLSSIKEAKLIILNLQKAETLSDTQEHFQNNWNNIVQQTIVKEKAKPIEKKIKPLTIKRAINWKQYAVAAAFLGLFSIIAIAFFQNNPVEQQKISATVPTMEWIEVKNTTVIEQVIQLVDGSTITLEPFSTLKYPTQFLKKQREVVLKGEAFFDIARDTTKPFVVYANETITKVLGTSFTIKAFEGEKEVEVAVKTGKVAVYANVNSLPKKIIEKKEKFVIRTDEQIFIPIPNKKLEVTPNQRVVFNKVRSDMTKAVAKLPLPVKPVKQLPKFRFVEEPLSEVFQALAAAYELDLHFDETHLDKCLITTNLEDVSIFSKLDIICQAMGLTYQEQNAVIHIYGGDCE